MSPRFRPFASIISAAFAIVLVSTVAHADVSFNDFSAFTINQTDTSSAPSISSGTIHLTTGGSHEARSIFANSVQNISQFTASFTYQDVRGSDGLYGAAFVLQNNSAGAHAVGGFSANFGYGGLAGKSAAISLETEPGSFSGFYTDGAVGGGSISTSPVNLPSGDLIDVTLTYNGSVLNESLVDTANPTVSYNTSFVVNLPTVLGTSSAFVGLTASTNFASGSNQYFSNFNFTTAATPEPASLSLLGVAGILVLRRRR